MFSKTLNWLRAKIEKKTKIYSKFNDYFHTLSRGEGQDSESKKFHFVNNLYSIYRRIDDEYLDFGVFIVG